MPGTYWSLLIILIAAGAVGQGAFALCGRRRWSWLSPVVGLAVLMALEWAVVRLPGDAVTALVVLALATAGGLALAWGRVDDVRVALRIGLPVLALALVAASLPFLVEGRFGILGTGLDPDMSQHLFAADRLASGGTERLISHGYPLGPHALVVAVAQAGPSLVQAFDGLALAIAVAACLAPLGTLRRLPAGRRAVGALLVGLPYMVASTLVEGAFKEALEALFVLAFAIGLHELARGHLAGRGPRRRERSAVPLGLLCVGCAYAYSFPGLIWVAGAAALWAVAELALARHEGGSAEMLARIRGAVAPAAVALLVVIVAIAPEAGRMSRFASFETFDPTGAGLGNLFNAISPLEALGIWPSGDFRLDPGDGAAPALLYYAGGVIGLAALAYGLVWWLRRREPAIPAALAVASAISLYANLAGTPYQEAKAIAIASPLVMLIAARALLAAAPGREEVARIIRRRGFAPHFPRAASRARRRLAVGALTVAFVGGAAFCSLLALANGPVGPAGYSPALAELRSSLGSGSTLVLAPERTLADEHGRDYLVWELRGGRVCVESVASVPAPAPDRVPPPAGIARVLVLGNDSSAPYAGLAMPRSGDGYTLWSVRPAPAGDGPCPPISSSRRADPGA